MDNRHASLALVSSYPPPYGGVSTEVQRLLPLLEGRGVKVIVYNAVSESEDRGRVFSVCKRRRRWLLRYMWTARESAIYFMSPRLATWVVAALMAVLRGKRVMVQLRSAELADWVTSSWWRRTLAGLTLRRMSKIVCVSQLLKDSARKVGVKEERLLWCPAFLPPDASVNARDEVAPEVWDFARVHQPVIAANGKVDWYKGQDLYGLDLLVELAARLKPDYPNLGIVVCFWDHRAADQAYLDRIIGMTKDKGVAENILLNTKRGLFVPVLAAADLFVRPTNTDGDAVSIREALYLGVPTVASDAVERPGGTRLFRSRDVEDFEAQVRLALSEARNCSGRRAPSLAPQDRQRIEAYVDLLAEIGAES